MSDSGSIVVRRPRGRYRDSLRRYRIEVDGVVRARLRREQQVEVTVAPGHHVVRAAIDWTGSPEVKVDVPAGGSVTLTVQAGGSAVSALPDARGRHTYLDLSLDQ